MPQHALNTPVCRDCDGFPVVAITTGTRNPDGTRTTLTVTCSTCKGTGHATRSASLARAGR
ncbi:hypothetical protein TUSST3_83390 [Streptomyces sp. TUS-ST3]|uniref:hypothetical protein n=1 Tax=Streptomyces sp. TUS-ST3 TaxID=3025591 RepID=UPI00235B30A3|nr:hypothetical protein [Streptomyces sp. TUS-ST3]GLP71720.1 hypothetical protein TUSST3_83390 [Streptomyces sp. TUS-ST3]